MSISNAVLRITEHFVSTPKKEPLFGPVSLELKRGHRLGVSGPSGCGKSTLLRDIVDLYLGRRQFDSIGVDAPSIDFVGQGNYLFPWFSCIQTCQTLAGVSDSPEWRDSAMVLAEDLGVEDCVDSFPTELSGGQLQRIGLWTALLRHPDLLILDEPLTALDIENKMACVDVLSNWLIANDSVALLLVSHDFDILSYVCDEILLIGSGPNPPISTIKNSRYFDIDTYNSMRTEGMLGALWTALSKPSRSGRLP